MKNHMCRLKSNGGYVIINTREIAAEYRLAHWVAIIRERNESGKSIKAYCESIGLHQNVYFYWQRKLREAACRELLPMAQAGFQPAANNPIAVHPDQSRHQLQTANRDPSQGDREITPSGWAICTVAQSEVSGNGTITVEVGKFKLTITNSDDMGLLAKVCQTLVSIC